jgi:hypothetical protein
MLFHHQTIYTPQFLPKNFSMPIKLKFITAILPVVLVQVYNVKAQESVNAAGGQATGRGGTVSFSVGQIAYTAETSQAGLMAQGIQRPYRVSLIENRPGHSQSVFESVVYPNPTSDDLVLQIHAGGSEKLHFRLMDLNGKVLNGGQLTGLISQIPTHTLAAGVYLLVIFDTTSNPLQTFQIIKN